jgi:hypothetical protein
MLTSRKTHCAIQELCTTLGFPCISLQFQTCHGCQLLKHFQRHHLLLKPTGQEREKTKSVRLIRPCARYVRRRCFCALLTWIWEMKSVSTSRPFTCNQRFAIQQLCQIKVPQTNHAHKNILLDACFVLHCRVTSIIYTIQWHHAMDNWVPQHCSLHSSTSQARMWLISLAIVPVHWSGVT